MGRLMQDCKSRSEPAISQPGSLLEGVLGFASAPDHARDDGAEVHLVCEEAEMMVHDGYRRRDWRQGESE